QSAIQALAAAGVTLGCNPPDNDRYCPDSPVTRAEMATFLARALDYPIISPPPRDDPPEGDPPGDEGGGGGEGDPCEVVCAGF
ncbi:MAG: S-layer homology domain-containing protein, partial [Acidimicrobiia bacterium]|nr:S-layer homology domain-containing protein [Acidimicrobiia bacterium]